MEKKTGGGIWLHSIPPHKTLKRGSRGCLVLREDKIKKVDPFIKVNQRAPILIYSKVEYITQEQLKVKRNEFMKWLNQWKRDWESKSSRKYMSHYSKNFYALGRNYKGWKKYKKAVSSKTRSISVDLKNTVVYKNKDQYVVKFLQDYRSSNVKDFGEKTLYVKLENNKPKIVTESWKHEVKKEVLGSLSLTR